MKMLLSSRQVQIRVCDFPGAASFPAADGIQGIRRGISQEAQRIQSLHQCFRRALCRFYLASSVRLGSAGRRLRGRHSDRPGEIRSNLLQTAFESLRLFGHV